MADGETTDRDSSSLGRDARAPVVLVADDEQLLADAYAEWLADAYRTRVAYDGSEALELLDPTVDVALLDRKMPGSSGDEIASVIRERGLDCQVAMISANEPGTDVLDVAYDQYLVKPITDPDELHSLLDTLERRASYRPEMQRLLALASKRADVEAYTSDAVLEDCDAYRELVEELDRLQSTVAGAAETLGDEGFRPTFGRGE